MRHSGVSNMPTYRSSAISYHWTEPLKCWRSKALGCLMAGISVTGCSSVAPQMDASSTPVVVGEHGNLDDDKSSKAVNMLIDAAPYRESFGELLNTVVSMSATPLYVDSRVDLLVDGPATYAAMLDAISAAKHFIHVETYIFADDKVGKRFADALIAKARDGVAVRVIFDSIGSFSSGNKFFDDMREAGIEVYEYNSINPFNGGNPVDANVRDHRKLLIVDGDVGFNGGINFSRTHTSRPGQQTASERLTDGWRDTHVAVYGPAVAALQRVFEKNWNGSENENPAFEAPPPETRHAGSDSVLVIAAKGGDGVESPIYHAYLEAIRLARQRVWITQAYFVPDKRLLAELESAARRGVDVRMVVPGLIDSQTVLHASRSHYGRLLKHGVRICETTTSVLHAKTAVVDGVWATVGSSNLDPRSNLHNDEVNVIVFGAEFSAQMESLFNADQHSCKTITLKSWRDRPFKERFLEFVSRPLSYWL
jgi:cardiolipin synthase A/B